MQMIVAESGYIHSAGYSVYARRAEKAEQYDLEHNLGEFLSSRFSGNKIYFTPFAREYFAPYQDKNAAASMRNGLDGLQFDLRKQHIGGQPVQDILPKLHSRFEKELQFASGETSFNTERSDSSADPSLTLFMLYDQRPVPTPEESYAKSVSSYLILYAQYILNGSQLITFEERKPAWPGPITLPHTLSASMLNVVKGAIRRGSENPLIILDPFCGTGTSLIDAAVRFPNASVIGIDRNPAMPRLVSDNLEFFSLSSSEISDMTSHILRLKNALNERITGSGISRVRSASEAFKQTIYVEKLSTETGVDYEDDFNRAIDICKQEIGESIGQVTNSDFSRSMQDVLEDGFSDFTCRYLNRPGQPLHTNLIFYLTWRSIVNARNTISGNPKGIYNHVVEELERFSAELRYLDFRDSAPIETNGSFSFHQGVFSRQSAVSLAKMAELKNGLKLCEQDSGNYDLDRFGKITLISGNSVEVLNSLPRKVDILIGDPPYWFNTMAADIDYAQKFYSDFIEAAVGSISSGGQIIMPVLQYSRNGRQVPFFQTRGAIVRQIFGAAEALGRRIIAVSHTSPGGPVQSNPPFYWNSTAVLSRRILWFTID